MVVVGISVVLVCMVLGWLAPSILGRQAVEVLFVQSSRHTCPDYASLVRLYLDPYRNPAPEHIQQKADALLLASQQCVRYNITGGDISRWPAEGYPPYHFVVFENNLRAAVRLYGGLPDVSFWFCMNDEPILPRAAFPGPFPPRPPLGFCARGDYHAISVPYMEQRADGDKAVLDRLANLKAKHPWDKASNTAVWRGSTTGIVPGGCNADTWKGLPRAHLVGLSLENEDLLDARFASNSQCTPAAGQAIEDEGYGYEGFLGLEDYFQHTMLVDVDGNSWSSRFAELLGVESAVFKQESEYWDWFWPLLRPNEHFIPVKRDLSDLIPLLRDWSQRGEALHAIATESSALYRRLLTPSKQLCYLHVLLTEYATLDAEARHGPSLRSSFD